MTSTGRNIFNNETIIGVSERLQNLQNANIAQDKVAIFKLNNEVETVNVSSYGKQLLNETSFASFRQSILEGSEEAIKYTGDSVYEILFHTNTGGTANAGNLRFKITDTTASLENNVALNCNDVVVAPTRSLIASYIGSDTGNNLNLRYGASVYQQFNANGIEINQNVVMAQNKHLKQKIEDSGSRVLVESEAKQQYCLYSYEANSNSGLLIQANGDVMEINNYKNSAPAGYRPISINRNLDSYLVVGAGVNPTTITDVNTILNGKSLFCNGASPSLYIDFYSVKPYLDVIPNGTSLKLGNGTNYFAETHTNYLDVKSHVFMDFFGSTDIKNEGFYFRSGFSSGSGIQDNMSIRAHNASGANDGIAISAYGGVSINCGLISVTNDNGNDAATNRAMLINTKINCNVDILPNSDGSVDIGSSSLKFSEIYGNNVRSHTSLYSSSIRPYSGSTIHFHNADITTDTAYSLAVDTLKSTADNNNLVLATGSNSRMTFINTGGIQLETTIYPAITGQQSVGTSSNKFNLGYINGLWADTINGNSTLELYGGAQKHLTLGNGGGTFVSIHSGLRPATSTIDIGGSASADRFRNIYLEENAYLTNLKPIGTNTSVRCGAHFFPELNDTYTLGGSPGGIDRLWNEIYCSNNVINTSDRRKKKDIVEINTQDALKTINKLKPVKYKWINGKSGRTHLGFIAQDIYDANILGLKDNFAGYVKSESGSLGLRYSQFIALNTSAIQELHKKLKILAIRVNNGGEVKSDLSSFHTADEDIIERLEILENRELTPIHEEYDDTEILEKVKQNEDEIENLKQENSELKEQNKLLNDKLEGFMKLMNERFMQYDEKLKENSTNNIGMNIIETDDGEDAGYDMLNGKIMDVEKQINKLDNKVKKLTTGYNKLIKKI